MKRQLFLFMLMLVILAMIMPSRMQASITSAQPVDGEQYATAVVKITDVVQTAQTVTTDPMATQIAQSSTQSSQATPEDMTAGQAESRQTWFTSTMATGVDRGQAPMLANGDVSDQAASFNMSADFTAASGPTCHRSQVMKTCTGADITPATNDENPCMTRKNLTWSERGQAPMVALIICYFGDDGGPYLGVDTTPKIALTTATALLT